MRRFALESAYKSVTCKKLQARIAVSVDDRSTSSSSGATSSMTKSKHSARTSCRSGFAVPVSDGNRWCESLRRDR
eukprot:1550137-Rhodomonas_salina.2